MTHVRTGYCEIQVCCLPHCAAAICGNDFSVLRHGRKRWQGFQDIRAEARAGESNTWTFTGKGWPEVQEGSFGYCRVLANRIIALGGAAGACRTGTLVALLPVPGERCRDPI